MLETKGRKTVLVDAIEFAEILQLNTAKTERLLNRIHARVAGIGLGDVCGRCGGSGHYSYNQMDGTRCYGCGGNKTLMPKLSEAFYEKVKEVIKAGVLDTYLERLAQRGRIEKARKTLSSIVSKSQISADFDSEYDRERKERSEENRRVDALSGGRAMGEEFTKHFKPENIKEMNEYVRQERHKQSKMVREYEDLEDKLRRDKGYGMMIARRGQKLLTDDENQECETLLLAKYEEVKSRLEQQEAEYKPLGLGKEILDHFKEIADTTK